MRVVATALFAVLVVAVGATSIQTKWNISDLGADPTSAVLADDGQIVFGANDGRVYAVSAESGAVNWQHTTDSAISNTPCTALGMVFAAGKGAETYALNLTTGALIWKSSVPSGSASPSALTCSAELGLVFFTVGSPVVIDMRSGNVTWTAGSPFPRDLSTYIPATIVWRGSPRRPYAFFPWNCPYNDCSTQIMQYDATTGDNSQSSQSNTVTWINSIVALSEDTLVCAATKGVAYATSNGADSWNALKTVQIGSGTCNTEVVALNENTVVVGTCDGQIAAYAPLSNTYAWRATTLGGASVHTSASVYAGVVYVADVNGVFYAVSAADGIILATRNLTNVPQAWQAAPVTSLGTVVMVSKRSVYALTLAHPPPPPTPAPPVPTPPAVPKSVTETVCVYANCTACQQIVVSAGCHARGAAASVQRTCLANGDLEVTVFGGTSDCDVATATSVETSVARPGVCNPELQGGWVFDGCSNP